VPARLPELAAELVALKPDVILAGSVSGILAARTATRTIPLIFFVIEDPVAMGLVSSITRPGGNITGIWMFGYDSLVAKRLEFLKHVVPGLARIGVIINPGDQSDAIYLKHLPATARALGIHLVIFEARTWPKSRRCSPPPCAMACKHCLLGRVLINAQPKPY
jgi:putative ABC transport system substrate-binding protein